MRKYISKHRKALSFLCLFLAAIIITVTTIGVVNNVTAGVFKGQNDKEKKEKGGGNEVVILEIVPEYGQQILGYTVEGCEPITKEAIEAYPVDGPADLSSAEFTAATGWTVNKTTDGYVVNENEKVLGDAFNKNVLGDALETGTVNSEIKVIVRQANDVVASDFDKCDLVYITNPKENDKNLLYYYDQVMNYNPETGAFSDKVAPGETGAYYDDIEFEEVLASDLAVRLIKDAAGRETALDLESRMAAYYETAGINNTRGIFEVAELEAYRSCNEEEYIQAIKEAEKGSLSDAEDINLLLQSVNVHVENAAIDTIKNSAGNAEFIAAVNSANEEEKQEALSRFKKVMIQANLMDSATGTPLFIEENFDLYVDKVVTTPTGGFSLGRTSINTAVKFINDDHQYQAREQMIAVSGKTPEEIQTALNVTVFHKANIDIYKDSNLDKYMEALAEAPLTSETAILNLVKEVNDREREAARGRIASAVGNAELAEALTENDLELAEIEGYHKDLADKYKEAIAAANAEDIIVQTDKTPVYDEPAPTDVVLHFSSGADYETLLVKVKYSEEGAEDTYTDLGEYVLQAEENSNHYYRTVIPDVPQDKTVAKLVLTVSDSVDDVAQFTVPAEDGKVSGEYWGVCRTDVADSEKIYPGIEDVLGDASFGDAFRYGDFLVNEMDMEKMTAVFTETKENNSRLAAEVSFDFASWDVSKALLEYVFAGDSGLVFSSDIVKQIGHYKWDNNANPTRILADLEDGKGHPGNQLYKALLAVKLIGCNSFPKTMLDKITDEGVYYPQGLDAEGTGRGTGYSEWNMRTTFNKNELSVSMLFDRVYTYGKQVAFNGEGFIGENNYEKDVTKTLGSGDVFRAVKDLKDIHGKVYTLGDVIRYTMNLYINQLQSYPFDVLEIQPISYAGTLNSYDGAKKLAEWLRIDYSDMNKNNFKEYFHVTSMSIREFNTQNKDLTGTYDLIYFGTNSGNMSAKNHTLNGKTYKRTYFKDSHLEGCLYTGVGDLVKGKVNQIFRGSLAVDYMETGAKYTAKTRTAGNIYNGGKTFSIKYDESVDYAMWKKYFTAAYRDNADDRLNLNIDSATYVLKTTKPNIRLAANDITMKKYGELMDYLKAGYPILMEDEIINASSYLSHYDYPGEQYCDRWTYVDHNSKLYHFIEEAKKLGYDEAAGTYTGKDKNGENVFADGGKYASLVNTECARYGANPEHLSAENQFKGGLSFATKRNYQVKFEYLSGPTEYDSHVDPTTRIGTTIAYGSAEYRKYKIELGVSENVDMAWLEENYSFQMYIDKSGLGTFSEEKTVEMDPDIDFDYANRKVIIEGNWPADENGVMDGFVPWRVEAYQKANPDNHYVYTGYSAFQKVDKSGASTKKDIEVLWVKADWKDKKTDENHLAFDTVANTDIPEYNIRLTTVSYYQFANNTAYWPKADSDIVYDSSNTKLKVGVFNSDATGDRIDKEFDMLVFGYCDSYNGLDINNMNTLKNIEYFVNSGHSLFFAHDNSSYQTTVLNYSGMIPVPDHTTDQTVVYYYNRNNWETPYIHYKAKNSKASGDWDFTEKKMTSAGGGYWYAVVPMNGKKHLTMCFKDRSGSDNAEWDSNNGNDYYIKNIKGEVATVVNTTVSRGEPAQQNIGEVRDATYFAKYTTSYMRGMLGMDLYGVSYSPKAFIYGYDSAGNPVTREEADENTVLNPLYNEAIYNARLYTDNSYDDQMYRGFAEGTALRQIRYGNDGNNENYSTYQTNGGLGNTLNVGNVGTTTSVRMVNKGQVSMYPYVMDETITVAATHYQYLALNLEDEDTVVWGTLDSANANNHYGATSGDGSNNYYIYTNGNITYTGAGHAEIGTSTVETKLFLNTVVAAIKAGNYGPEVSFTNKDSSSDKESVIYSYDTDKCTTVKFKVNDVDRKRGEAGAFSDLKIYFDKIGDADDSSGVEYNEGVDLMLNQEEGVSGLMMNGEATDYINYNKENVLNRTEYTFTLSYVDLANKYNELKGIGDRYSVGADGTYYKNGVEGLYSVEIKNLASKFFSEYRIAITATDIPKLISSTVDSATSQTGITSTSVARVAFRTLFNLN